MVPEAQSREEFLAECKDGKLDGVVAICDRAPHSLAVTGKFDQELIQALPESVKFLCHNGEPPGSAHIGVTVEPLSKEEVFCVR